MSTGTKYIFLTGGVVSSVGKGVTAAALGRLLKERGFKVSIQKLDPYINVDPGTMSPYQHGEVYVLDDGAETDLDLGHYERFIDISLTRECNVTSGQIYSEVIGQERRGDFLGGTIQVIPHITNEIKHRIGLVPRTTGAELILVEVGGTVGDIESLPYLEALRQMRNDVGRENTLFIHVTWLPHIGATGELKTKPTQHSVRELRSIGISPDVIVARSDFPVGEDLREKIALFCDVEARAVIPLVTTDVLYEVPLFLEREGLGEFVVSRLGLTPQRRPDWTEWERLVASERQPRPPVRIALVGKYVELRDAYISVREAVRSAANRELHPHLLKLSSERLRATYVYSAVALGAYLMAIFALWPMVAPGPAWRTALPPLGGAIGLSLVMALVARIPRVRHEIARRLRRPGGSRPLRRPPRVEVDGAHLVTTSCAIVAAPFAMRHN